MTGARDIGVVSDQFAKTDARGLFSSESGRACVFTAEQVSSSKLASIFSGGERR